MNIPEAERPLGFDMVASPIGSARLEQSIGDNALWYIRELAQAFPHDTLVANAAAQPFAHQDIAGGIEIVSGSGKSFYRGVLLGMGVVREYFPAPAHEEMVKRIGGVAAVHRISMVAGDYSRTAVQEASLSMIRGASPGWDAARPLYEQIFGYWDNVLSEDERFRRHTRLGFGLVFGKAGEVWERRVEQAYAALTGEINLSIDDDLPAIEAYLREQP